MKSNKIQSIAWGVFFVLIVGALIWLNVLKTGSVKNPRALHLPQDRLVGHWQLYSRSDLPSYELFFAPLDETGRGRHTMVDDVQDQILLQGYYEPEPNNKNELTVDIHVNLGAQIDRKVTVVIEREGMAGEYNYERGGEKYRQKMTFIDDETEYTFQPAP